MKARTNTATVASVNPDRKDSERKLATLTATGEFPVVCPFSGKIHEKN